MTLQKKTGPENLPLKAVIALMGAAAAAAAAVAVLSRPAKDPRTGSIHLSLSFPLSQKRLGGWMEHISYCVQC